MSMQNGAPDFDEQLEQQQQMQSQQSMQDRASQIGMGTQNLQDLVDQDDLLDTLLDYDITRGPEDELEDELKTEFSNLFMTSNLTGHEVSMFQTWSDQEAHLKSLQYPRSDSLASGTRGQIMYGPVTPAERADAGGSGEQTPRTDAYAPKPPLTDEMEMRLWSAADAKKAAVTRSKSGWLIKRFTEFVAVGVTEKRTEEESSGGILSGIKDRIV